MKVAIIALEYALKSQKTINQSSAFIHESTGQVLDTGKDATSSEPTDTHVSSLAACQRVLAAAGAGVHRNGFADDKTILHQFTDLLACEKNVVKKTKHVRCWKYCCVTHKTKCGHGKV